MNYYQAFYKQKQITVKAETSYQAQLIAAQIFKVKKSYQVTIVLAALENGKPIIHTPNF